MLEVVDQTFDASVNAYDKVLVYFWADWCNPCKTISPMIEKLYHKYDQVPFLKAHVDANMRAAMKANLIVIPTVVIYEKGQPMLMLQGNQIKEQTLETYLV